MTPDLDQMKRDVDRLEQNLNILTAYIKKQIVEKPEHLECSDPHGVLAFPPKNGLECVTRTDGFLNLFAKIAIQGVSIDKTLTWSHGKKQSRVEMLIKSIMEHIAAIPDEQKFDRKRLAREMAYLISQCLVVEADGEGH